MNNTLQGEGSHFMARDTDRHERQQQQPVSTRTKTAPTEVWKPVSIGLWMGVFWRKRRQYSVYIVLSFLAIGLTALLVPSSSAYFLPYFGRTNPVLVVVLASIVGGVSLCFLHTRGKFEILRGRTILRGIGVSAGMASVLALAFVTEIAFRVLPITLLLFFLAPLRKKLGSDRRFWSAFRRYDFASMYSFRLVYYAYWHVAWGVIRLKVLF
jgi:hypothetical protein